MWSGSSASSEVGLFRPTKEGRAEWRVKSKPQAEICAGRIHFARALKLKRGPRTAKAGWGEADVLYGVTMQEQGISRMLTINLNDVEKELNIK